MFGYQFIISYRFYGFISSNQLVKVLGNGSLTTKLDVEANAFSKSAVAAIEAVGGNAVKL